MADNFWKGKNVLITGYEGFLGSALTRALIGLGANITGLDIRIHRKETILTKSDFAKITVIKGNVVNYGLIKKILKARHIKIIMHLAAETIVTKSRLNPLKTFQSNIRGTWNILEASRDAGGIEAVLIASSDKAYGGHARLPYSELTPLQGDHPYDVSKSCADLLANTYFHTYNLPVAVTRCGNIYGPGDSNISRIIPDAVRSALLEKTLFVRSDGKFTRDYIYIDDVVSGYVILARKIRCLKLAGQAFNFSNGKPTTVLDLVKFIYKLVRSKPNYQILDQAAYEIRDQYLRAGKARRVLGWKPKYSLERGLQQTIRWYKEKIADMR